MSRVDEPEDLRTFLEESPVAVRQVGPDGKILWANRAELELLGYSRDEYVGHDMAEFHVDPDVSADLLARLRRGEQVHDVEARMRAKDGSIRWVLIRSNARMDGGRFVHSRCFTRDITDRKRAEREAQEQRSWLQTTLASIADAVIATDVDDRVAFMNPVAERLTGWTREQATGRPLVEVFRIINEHTRAAVANPVEKVRETGAVVGLANHTILVARDGVEVAIDDSAAPIVDTSGQMIGVVLVFRDIRERRRLELAGQRLAAIVECSADAIVGKSLEGIVTSWNAAAERIFGWSAQEMVGRPIQTIIPPERSDEEPAILARIRRGERVEHFETVRVRKDHTRIPVSVTISPIQNARGEVVGASKIARDISDEVSLREQLQARVAELADADRRKDEFLAMLAHELRNPLGAISNAVHLLADDSGDETVRQRAVQVLRRQVQHQSRIVNELIDVSRITRGLIELHTESLDLVRLVRDAAEDYRVALEHQRIFLELELPQNEVWVRGDPTRLAQVVSNLLSNALKFTSPGGRVTVSVRAVRGADGESRAMLTVADDGIGIEPGLLPHVFESFTHGDLSLARARGGLGLGLAIVKGLVDLHTGEVEVESPGHGGGTTVRVRLPVLEPASRDASSVARPSLEAGLRVLVIEDHRDAAEMLGELLSSQGHEVSIALTGAEGVRLAREQHPDVILCDLGLPGMDGYAVAAALRTAPGGARQRLVAVTGYGQDEDRRRTREAGFRDHLVKPIDPEELQRVLSGVAEELRG